MPRPRIVQSTRVNIARTWASTVSGFSKLVVPGTAADKRGTIEGTISCLGNVRIRGDDLAGNRGPKPQYEGASRADVDIEAAWIRQQSGQYRVDCTRLSLPYVDVGDLGFDAAMTEARNRLLGARQVPRRTQ